VRIHTDKITRADLSAAAVYTHVGLIDPTEHKSRSRNRAFKFSLTGSSNHRGQFSNGDWDAATWDEWGIFLNHLFEIDPLANNGTKYGYLSAQHFHWVTGDRFRTIKPRQQHRKHHWEARVNFDPDFQPHVLGYGEAWCACRAIQRWVMPGNDYYSLFLEGKMNHKPLDNHDSCPHTYVSDDDRCVASPLV